MSCLPKWVAAVLFCASGLRAQSNVAVMPESSVAGVLGSLSARADVAFAGQVVEVRRLGGVVEVEFRVDQRLKGTVAGTYILREWGGLWTAGQQRYWPAERAVVFLHTAAAAGLGSSVDGMEGVLPLSQVDASAPAIVDVSRLRAAALRDMGEPMVDAPAQMPLTELAAIVKKAAGSPPENVPVHGGPVVAAPVSAVSDEPVRLPKEARRLPRRADEMPRVADGQL